MELAPAREAASLNNCRNWWARQDSNLQPDGYEPPALTIELRALAGSHGAAAKRASITGSRRALHPHGGLPRINFAPGPGRTLSPHWPATEHPLGKAMEKQMRPLNTLAIAALLAPILEPPHVRHRSPGAASSAGSWWPAGGVEAPPSAEVTTGVVSEAATARAALDANSAAMRKVVDGLKAAVDLRTSRPSSSRSARATAPSRTGAPSRSRPTSSATRCP